MLTTADWASILAARLGRPVEVSFGRSRTRPVQAQLGVHAKVRLHHLFRDASPAVAADLAAWLHVGRRARNASDRLDAWLDARLAALPAATPRRVLLTPRGDVHDLAAMATELQAREFPDGFVDGPLPGITWGRRTPSRARRSLRLGTYQPATRIVRVHPVLDRTDVPPFFVRYVLFHELLHAALPGEVGASGRCLHHGPRFRARELTYPEFARAVAWQRRHTPRLIRAARRLRAYP